MPERRGIYLDAPYTNALIALSYTEGLIKTSDWGAKYTDYIRDFVGAYANPSLTPTALQMLVLHGRCWLSYEFDRYGHGIFDLSGLPREFFGVVQPEIVGFTPLDPEMGLPLSPSAPRKPILEELLYPTFAYLHNQNVEVSIDDLRSIVERVHEFDAAVRRRWMLRNMAEFEGRGLNAKERLELQALNKRLAKVLAFFKALRRVYELTLVSSAFDVPALWVCPITPHNVEGLSVRSDDLIVAGVYFDGLRAVKVRSLSDALRLLEDQRIDEFRNEVFSAIQRVRSEGLTEGEMMKTVQRANRILERAALAGPVGTILTILGIPGMFFPPLGIAVTAAGVSVLAGAYAARRRVNWALVANVPAGRKY